jgi:hypothetical protein
VIIPAGDVKALNRQATEGIRKRAEKLAKLHPAAAGSLFWYVEKQERGREITETAATSAVWLLQRA